MVNIAGPEAPMRINAEYDKKVVVRPQDYLWVDSPVKGVKRVMLDRVGGEVARATSIVLYTPNSDFPQHVHGGGEEIFVLQGEFADEHGRYPAGSYLRNPIGTRHSPRVGDSGALIFVKLHQFDEQDIEQKVIYTSNCDWFPGLVEGLEVLPLHSFASENVALVKWHANTQFNPHSHLGGEEIFVINGTFYDEHGAYTAGSWIRSPHLSSHTPFTREDGALIMVKTGHLPA